MLDYIRWDSVKWLRCAAGLGSSETQQKRHRSRQSDLKLMGHSKVTYKRRRQYVFCSGQGQWALHYQFVYILENTTNQVLQKMAGRYKKILTARMGKVGQNSFRTRINTPPLLANQIINIALEWVCLSVALHYHIITGILLGTLSHKLII